MRHFLCFLLLITMLSACEVEGGVSLEETATPLPLPSAVPSALAETSSQAGLRIGLREEPTDVLPYHIDANDERITAPLSELLLPAPLLALNYTYTTTGVLDRVPSEANGDVVIGSADVFLDAAGVITTTQTDVVTQVQQISVTFHWNPDLRWSDGTAVTADDSVFAYEVAQQVSLGQEADNRLAMIDTYEQVDEHTTRAVLRPDFTDTAYVTTVWTPFPRHLLQGQDPTVWLQQDFALSPLSYGPYMVDQRDRGTVRLTRNPYYFETEPAIDVVTFVFRDDAAALSSSVDGGSLDVVVIEQPDSDTFAALANSTAVITTVTNPIWEHLDFNLDIPVLQNILVRRAIAHGTNRQGMIDSLLGGGGSPLNSWIVPGQPAAAPADQLTVYDYNPEQARALLDEAGVVDSDGDGVREFAGEPVALTLLTTERSALRSAIAEQFKADIAAIGLSVTVQELPSDQLYSPEGPLFRREFQLALFAWIAEPDPRGFERWSCAAVPSQGNQWTGNNFAGWCFFEADQAIRTATTSFDQAERREAYLRQQQLLSQEIPVFPLFQRVTLTVHSPRINGVTPDPTAPITWNIATWTR